MFCTAPFGTISAMTSKPSRSAADDTSPKVRMLIADDEPDFCALVAAQFDRRRFEMATAGSVAAARKLIAAESFDVLLLDLDFPDGNGIDLLAKVRKDSPATKVIIISGSGTVDRAVEAMKAGASDFLAKPFNGQTLARLVDLVLGPSGAQNRGASSIVGRSEAMTTVVSTIERFAPTDVTLLILGESGTGKEVAARAIHALSRRADGPFVDLDCAAVPSTLLESELFGHEKGAFTDARDKRLGRFELAQRGTLFLDEIGNLSLEAQAKLLRVLQERSFRRVGGDRLIPCDVRVLAATNLDLEEAVARGAFRQDLYFRLAELTLHLPPLRERTGDVEALVGHFLVEFNARYVKSVQGLTPRAQALLDKYSWPGNVRELQSVVRSALLMCDDRIDVQHLPERIRGSSRASHARPAAMTGADEIFQFPFKWPAAGERFDLKQFTRAAKRQMETRIIAGILEREGYSKAELARCLGLDYKVLSDKMLELGVKSATRKRAP